MPAEAYLDTNLIIGLAENDLAAAEMAALADLSQRSADGRACPDSGSPRSAFRRASNAMSRIARTRVATSSSRSCLSSVASAIPMIAASGDPRRYW